jgi:hypothetical protein
MKQAQQMQEKMQKMQEEIAQLEVTGESGANEPRVVPIPALFRSLTCVHGWR